MAKKTLNIVMPEELYRELVKMKVESEAENWIDFFKALVSGEIKIFFRILSVDGEEPDKHVCIFKLGDRVFRYENGVSKPLDRGAVAVEVMKALARG